MVIASIVTATLIDISSRMFTVRLQLRLSPRLSLFITGRKEAVSHPRTLIRSALLVRNCTDRNRLISEHLAFLVVLYFGMGATELSRIPEMSMHPVSRKVDRFRS
jgi:hypothetical protein